MGATSCCVLMALLVQFAVFKSSYLLQCYNCNSNDSSCPANGSLEKGKVSTVTCDFVCESLRKPNGVVHRNCFVFTDYLVIDGCELENPFNYTQCFCSTNLCNTDNLDRNQRIN